MWNILSKQVIHCICALGIIEIPAPCRTLTDVEVTWQFIPLHLRSVSWQKECHDNLSIQNKKDMLRLHREWAGIIRASPARAPTPAAAQLPQSPPTYTGTWTDLRHRVASGVASPVSERSYRSAPPDWMERQTFRYTVMHSRSPFQNALLESLLAEGRSLWNTNWQTHNRLRDLLPAWFTQESVS